MMRAVNALDVLLRRVPSFIQLLVVEFIAILMFGGGAGQLLAGSGARGCPPQPQYVSGTTYFFLIGGGAILLFLLWRIFSPRVKNESFTPVHAGGGVALPQFSGRINYTFLTSHPSYVLIDLIAVVGPAFLAWMARGENCASNGIVLTLQIAVYAWAIIPIARLVCWYALWRGPSQLAKLRGTEEARDGKLEWHLAWKPALTTFAIFFVVFGGIAAWVGIEQLVGK